jgi:hypothetical protein
VVYRFEWNRSLCESCVSTGQNHRTILVGERLTPSCRTAAVICRRTNSNRRCADPMASRAYKVNWYQNYLLGDRGRI